MPELMSLEEQPLKPVTTDITAQITNIRAILGNTAWNVGGRISALLIGLLLTPFLLRSFGPSRWGVFGIALTITGMMGFFDFGLGRALSRSVAVNLSQPDRDSSSEVKTGILILLLCGIAGSLILLPLVTLWSRSALKVPIGLESEVRTSLQLVCLCVPIMILNSTLWSILAAYQQQRLLAITGTPIMILFYGLPILLFHWYPNLIGIILLILALRGASTYIFWNYTCRLMPGLRTAKLDWSYLRPLSQMGGWMAISGMMLPIFLYTDRFLIATFASAAVTGYYVTSSDLVSKLQFIPIAMNTSAFPALASSYRNDPKTTCSIFHRGVLLVTSALFIPALLITSFSNEILSVWLGGDFAHHAATVFRWFGVGILVAFAESSSQVIDAVGYPRVNALYSLFEIGLFIPLVAAGVKSYGIEGAAIAWSLKALVNFVTKTIIMVRVFPPMKSTARRIMAMVLGATSALLVSSQLTGTATHLGFLILALVAYSISIWFFIMTSADRSALLRIFQTKRRDNT